MVIFLIVMLTFSAARAQFSLIAARFRHAMFFWGLVLATEVAFVVIVVMRVVAALFVVVIAIAAARLAIFRIIVALLIGVPGLVAMNVARFANELWRSLLLRLVAFVFATARRFVAAIAIAIVAIIATARGVAFVGHIPHLVVVSAFNGASLSFVSCVVSLFDLLL